MATKGARGDERNTSCSVGLEGEGCVLTRRLGTAEPQHIDTRPQCSPTAQPPAIQREASQPHSPTALYSAPSVNTTGQQQREGFRGASGAEEERLSSLSSLNTVTANQHLVLPVSYGEQSA
jgi:hypothetical protein